MAHHDHGALKVQQKVLQPVGGGDIQVVGRLVHHQDVGVAKQSLSQKHLHLQPGVHVLHQCLVVLGAHTKALKDAGGVGFRLIPPQLGILGLKVGGLDAIGVGEVLLLVEGVHLLADIIKVEVAHQHRVHHGVGVILVLVLLQHRHTGIGQDGYLAGGGVQLPGKDLQKGRLAGPVGPDDAIAVPLHKLKVHMGKKRGAGIIEGKVGNGNHSILLWKVLSAPIVPARTGKGKKNLAIPCSSWGICA